MKKLLFVFCLFVGISTFCSCNSDEEEYVEIVNEWLGGSVTIFHHKDSLIKISKGEEVVIDMRHDAVFEYAKVTDNFRKSLNAVTVSLPLPSSTALLTRILRHPLL